MARPRKRRHVCLLPECKSFGPVDESTEDNTITMSVEEYESIRLIDLERLTQEESAKSMGVARSTIQRMYDEARQKIADSLVNGKMLKIIGGDYKLCEKDEDEKICKRRGCCRRRELEDDEQKSD